MNAKTAIWAPIYLLLATACGPEEEESRYEWQCYAREDFGSCECYEVTKGSSVSSVGSAEQVDSCEGHELCLSYYDTLREQGRCDCGDADFEPNSSESQRRDTRTEDSCPVKD